MAGEGDGGRREKFVRAVNGVGVIAQSPIARQDSGCAVRFVSGFAASPPCRLTDMDLRAATFARLLSIAPCGSGRGGFGWADDTVVWNVISVRERIVGRNPARSPITGLRVPLGSTSAVCAFLTTRILITSGMPVFQELYSQASEIDPQKARFRRVSQPSGSGFRILNGSDPAFPMDLPEHGIDSRFADRQVCQSVSGFLIYFLGKRK